MKYHVNVHYDYCASITVDAESRDEAIEKAEEIAFNMDTYELDYCGKTDSCITGIEK